jgi:1-pyrroline-5-carboxylate dehydrogenase
MSKGFFKVPVAINEPVRAYEPGSKHRDEVIASYNKMFNSNIDIPFCINGKNITTNNHKLISPPHDHKHIVGKYFLAEKTHVDQAISGCLSAREKWANLPWEQRSAIFLKAAELIAGPYRSKINAATMIAQSKTIHQAEIDASCEFIDFLRFNVQFVTDIYNNQPESTSDFWNRVEYRPLEGFVYAVTPFNFTAIAGNLPACMAMLGNVVVWKPSDSQIYSAKIIMDVFKEAGVPDGVINVVFGDPEMITNTVLSSPDFSGLHFTGSTEIFKKLWKNIGENISNYKTYPKIVGETGGKDFIVAHKSAIAAQVSTAIVRGAFEFQGQKCSAASRSYISQSIWDEVKSNIIADLKSIKMGSPSDTNNFVTAVIHENSFDKIANYIDDAKNDSETEIIAGGKYDKSKGYFIEPTVIVTTNPNYKTMHEEIFGPVMTIYIFKDS